MFECFMLRHQSYQNYFFYVAAHSIITFKSALRILRRQYRERLIIVLLGISKIINSLRHNELQKGNILVRVDI